LKQQQAAWLNRFPHSDAQLKTLLGRRPLDEIADDRAALVARPRSIQNTATYQVDRNRTDRRQPGANTGLKLASIHSGQRRPDAAMHSAIALRATFGSQRRHRQKGLSYNPCQDCDKP